MIFNLVIYKITNKVNGKVYIGQTINYEERVRHHKQTAFRPNSKDRSRPLYNAIIKYGIDNFIFEIIDTANSIDELNEKEVYYIQTYDSCVDNNKGYNLDKGGKNGRKSEETKRKIGNAQIGNLNHAYGKRGGDCHNAKRVKNITTGKIYPSMLDCAIEEYGDKKFLKQISRVCDVNSNRQTYKGSIYRLIDESDNIIEKNTEQVNEAFSKVKVIDIISGTVFESISEAAKFFEISSGMVRDRVYNRIKNDRFKNEFILKIYND